MNQVISVKRDNDRITVLARDLHAFLEVSSKFNDWFKRMCGYGFDENTDFIAITQIKVTAQGNESEYIDYQLTLDMAKEIAMIQRNEKGKQARRYFIEVEKEYRSSNKVKLPSTPKEILALLVADNDERDKRIDSLEKRIDSVESQKSWRTTMLDKVKILCKEEHIPYPTKLASIYKAVEQSVNCRLDARLKNMRERYMKSGHRYKDAKSLQKIDVIANDIDLKQAFEKVLGIS